ncbi:hypothetical protein LCGC14_0305700 [marine sediment metagenome]|uniref:Uncharacterized protein n=1 Tax=marine sediment metagenome TaxID=412755 RepID=A0A0F9WAH9_9ZZZZ
MNYSDIIKLKRDKLNREEDIRVAANTKLCVALTASTRFLLNICKRKFGEEFSFMVANDGSASIYFHVSAGNRVRLNIESHENNSGGEKYSVHFPIAKPGSLELGFMNKHIGKYACKPLSLSKLGLHLSNTCTPLELCIMLDELAKYIIENI